jgi:hypothetical protein
MSLAFLVDGITEQRFIQRICPNRPVRVTGLNGKSVRTDALAKRLASLIRLWNGRYYPIVIVVDRECREEAAADFGASLQSCLRVEGVTDQIVVGVADRMIENWMIADPAVWPAHQLPDHVDGCSGVNVVKGYMSSYDKAASGPVLLYRSRASEIKQRSPSFAALAEQLEGVDCHWLGR